jgi:tRNA threonylcarbamoyl adenosine modification protein YeaZ
MTILALEFSSEQRSVAVARGDAVLGEALETGDRSVAAFAMVEKVLAQAKIEREGIEAVAIGLGPGSYTGIRAAIALAQGWQLARAVKTIGVSSVAALAAQARAQKIFGSVSVVINAQRNEFYLATYEVTENECAETAPLKIVPRTEIESLLQTGRPFIGPEVEKFFKQGRTLFPRAATVAALAAQRTDFLPAEKLEPIYLRETTFVKAPAGFPRA